MADLDSGLSIRVCASEGAQHRCQSMTRSSHTSHIWTVLDVHSQQKEAPGLNVSCLVFSCYPLNIFLYGFAWIWRCSVLMSIGEMVLVVKWWIAMQERTSHMETLNVWLWIIMQAAGAAKHPSSSVSGSLIRSHPSSLSFVKHNFKFTPWPWIVFKLLLCSSWQSHSQPLCWI